MPTLMQNQAVEAPDIVLSGQEASDTCAAGQSEVEIVEPEKEKVSKKRKSIDRSVEIKKTPARICKVMHHTPPGGSRVAARDTAEGINASETAPSPWERRGKPSWPRCSVALKAGSTNE